MKLLHCRIGTHSAVLNTLPLSSVQSLSRIRLFATLWITACQASLSITNSQSSLKLMSIKSAMPSSHLIVCHPLLLLPAGSFPMSQLFEWDGQSVGVSASASVLPMNTQVWSPLGWLDLLAVQRTLRSLLQHHYSSKASILGLSAFFTVQLSHPYMTTGKTIVLS